MKIFIKWLLCALAFFVVASFTPGIEITSYTGMVVAPLVMGLLSTIARPVLGVLASPATFVTVGVFLFFVNALTFWFATGLHDLLFIKSPTAALVGALLYTTAGVVIDTALQRIFKKN